jgi:glycosyltransferase involved in cell wall biosynthesis
MGSSRYKMLDRQDQTPKRFLVCSGVRGDTRRYRSIHLYEQLKLLGADCHLARLIDFDLERSIDHAWEVVFFHRVAYDAYVERLIDKTRSRGALVLFDCDDLIFDPQAIQWIKSPEFNDAVRSNLFRASMQRTRQTLDACDAAITSTDFLAGQVGALGKPAWVHRNAFSLEMLTCSEMAYQNRQPHPGQVVIGYASGTPTHNHDFELTKPALKQVLAHFPQVELWLIGPVDPGSDWGELAGRIHHFNLVPWRKLPGLLAQLDINLAPLVIGNPFSQSKSEIKFMEAAMVRVPTVASPTEAFYYAIHAGENGFLARTDEEWQTALSQLVADTTLRTRLGEQAYADVIARYHPVVRSSELAAMLNLIYQSVKGKPIWNTLPSPAVISQNAAGYGRVHTSIPPRLAQNPSNFRLGIYSLLHNGPRQLLSQMWIFFRRLIAPIIPYRVQRK